MATQSLRPVRIDADGKSLGGKMRWLQRYVFPSVLTSLVLLARDRALVSARARVQLCGRIRFGRGSVVKSYSVVQTSGGRIRFGRDCAIGSFNYIAAGQADVMAGDHVRLGPHVSIIGTSREYRRKDRRIIDQGFADRGVRIGNDVLIGAGAVLVDGCEIGEGAVIGVGSVVTGRIPPYAVVFGAPAKVISWRT